MSVDSDIESFFKTLLLGDFDENQNSAAQIVGGLIAMIPILGQVMAGRDVAGALFHINKNGGFAKAGPVQIVNLGFAAFGAIPEAGPAFKTVFKPLWKERSLAKGVIHGGMEAIESLLHLGKGGAIGWVRKELLGKWAQRTQQAIVAVNTSMAAVVQLTEFIANASGWQDWLIPDSVQALAKEMLPGLKRMQGQISAPLQRASDEIRHFLEDILGEQAAAVVMAVGGHVAVASAVPGTRPLGGHNAADPRTKGVVPKRQAEQKVQGTPKANARKGSGPVHTAIQITRKALSDLATQEKGLIGEHVADYHELKRLGGQWPHDQPKGNWQPATVHKLNVDKRPVNISLADLPKVNQPGIDAVWEHAGQYTVTEAKAGTSIGAAYGLGKYKEKKGLIPVISGLNPDQQLLHYLLSDSSDKKGTQTPLMQMGAEWVQDRSRREGLQDLVVSSLRVRNKATYHRRVLLATLESDGGLAHVESLADVHQGVPAAKAHVHADHGITREWEATAIDAVDEARREAHKAKAAAPKPEESAPKPATRTRKPSR